MRRKLRQPLMAFGQDLECVMTSLSHHPEDALDVLERDVLVEEIAHRVDEDHPRALPLQWVAESARPQAKVEALLVRVPLDPAPALSERLGVAVRAAGGYLRATGHGVPGG